MTRLVRTLLVVAAAIGLAAVPAASEITVGDDIDIAADAPTLATPPPSWYTPALHEKVLASAGKGVEVKAAADPLAPLNCLGYSPPGAKPPFVQAVSAGGCMVYPHGCTMNFVFTDTVSNYIGTAGHCTNKGGDVVMQVATRLDPTDSVPIVTLAKIGRVSKRVNQGIGRDFALVKIDPGWTVVPGIAGAAGPTGVLCGEPLGQPVTHYGHGYVFLVGPGNPKTGEVIVDLDVLVPFKSTRYGYNWVGYGLPGDSGSPVMNDAGLAVGDLTHGLGVGVVGVAVPVPGLNFGTNMDGVYSIIGSAYFLVTVTGQAVRCTVTVPYLDLLFGL